MPDYTAYNEYISDRFRKERVALVAEWTEEHEASLCAVHASIPNTNPELFDNHLAFLSLSISRS